jgi:hypothetical protein
MRHAALGNGVFGDIHPGLGLLALRHHPFSQTQAKPGVVRIVVDGPSVHKTDKYQFIRHKLAEERPLSCNCNALILHADSDGIFRRSPHSVHHHASLAAKAAMLGLMNVLHLEGERHDMPSAATRMTAGLFNPDAERLLTPDSVAPGVLFLRRLRRHARCFPPGPARSPGSM